jgi:hypothetical protein
MPMGRSGFVRIQAMTLTIEGDRRESERMPLERPCKLFDPHTGKYTSATTRDLSHSGALINVPHLTHFNPGQTIHVGIALKRRDQLLRADEMLKAQIVRAMVGVDDHTSVAVQFAGEHADCLPAESPMRAAA